MGGSGQGPAPCKQPGARPPPGAVGSPAAANQPRGLSLGSRGPIHGVGQGPAPSPVTAAVREVATPLALWASQEKEAVLFRPGRGKAGGDESMGQGDQAAPRCPALQTHSQPYPPRCPSLLPSSARLLTPAPFPGPCPSLAGSVRARDVSAKHSHPSLFPAPAPAASRPPRSWRLQLIGASPAGTGRRGTGRGGRGAGSSAQGQIAQDARTGDWQGAAVVQIPSPPQCPTFPAPPNPWHLPTPCPSA